MHGENGTGGLLLYKPKPSADVFPAKSANLAECHYVWELMHHMVWTCIYYISYLTGRSNSVPADMITINLRISFLSISQIWMICQAGNMFPVKRLPQSLCLKHQTNKWYLKCTEHICHNTSNPWWIEKLAISLNYISVTKIYITDHKDTF